MLYDRGIKILINTAREETGGTKNSSNLEKRQPCHSVSNQASIKH
jgi:hypothetical protein